jgi:hypothetical protein
MKNLSDSESVHTFDKLHQDLEDHGLKPQFQIMDNECSSTLQRSLKARGIDLKLVPLHTHRHNVAESAIQTFKMHFIAGL